MALTEAQKKALYESTKKQATTAIQNGAKTTDEIKTSMEQKQKDGKKQKEEKIKLEAVKSKAAKNKEQDLIGAKDANKLADSKARKEIRENRENNVSNSFSKARQFQTVSAKAVSSEAGKQPMSATQYGKTQLSNQIYDKYRVAEDYYNNPYGNSLEKGLVNRLRSAGGETVENIAYFLKDNLAPETGYKEGEPITLENRDAAKRAKLVSNPLNQFLYNNAQDVVAKNTAGQIGDLADRQIIAAKENTGDFGDALINIADAGANMASQAILSGVLLPGAPAPIANKVLSGVQGVSAGGQKYRDTREAGGSQQEAFQRGLGSATIATITEGLGGIGKTGVSKIPGVDKIVTHLDELGTKNFITNALATGLEEGGEEGLEYAFEYLSDVFADLIYKGEIETDFNLADLFMNVVSGFGIGAGFGSVAGTANAYQNYDPNAKNKPNNVETNTPAEPPVSPAEAPIAEAENITPETANEQEGAFANVTQQETKEPKRNLPRADERFDKMEKQYQNYGVEKRYITPEEFEAAYEGYRDEPFEITTEASKQVMETAVADAKESFRETFGYINPAIEKAIEDIADNHQHHSGNSYIIFQDSIDKIQKEIENNTTNGSYDGETLPKFTNEILKQLFDDIEIARSLEVSKRIEDEYRAQVNSTNDAIEPANDVVENADAQPRAQENTDTQNGAHPNTVGAKQSTTPFYTAGVQYGTYEPKARQTYKGNETFEAPVRLDNSGQKEVSEAVETIASSPLGTEKTIDYMIQNIDKFTHAVDTDADSVNKAKVYLEENGLDKSLLHWKNIAKGKARYTKDDGVLAATTIRILQEQGRINEANEMVAELVAEISTSAQATQGAEAIYKILDPSHIKLATNSEAYINNLVKKLNEKYAGKLKKGKAITANSELLQKALEANGTDAEGDFWDKVYVDIANQVPSTFWERMNNYRYFCMLSNPKTHIRNVVSNTVMQGVNIVKDEVKVLVEKAYNNTKAVKSGKLQESRTVSGKSAPKEYKNFAKEDFKAIKDTYFESGKYNEDSGTFVTKHRTKINNNLLLGAIKARFKGDSKTEQLLNKVLDQGVINSAAELNSYLLNEVEDGGAKSQIYTHAMSQYMAANNLTPEYLSSPEGETDLMKARAYASAEALYNTFNENNFISNWLSSGAKYSKAVNLVTGATLPFRKVPINLVRTGYEYSPAGLIASGFEMAKAVKTQSDPGKAINDIAKGLTGTGLTVVGMILRSLGLLTNGLPEDEKEAKHEKMLGSQAFAFKVGDKSYTLDWLQPVGMMLFSGATAYDTLQDLFKGENNIIKKGDVWGTVSNVTEIGINSLLAFYEPMLEMSMLSNIKELVAPEHGRDWKGFGADIISDLTGQFVPNFLAALAKTIDDTERNAYYTDKTDAIPDTFQPAIQNVMAKIPGLSQKLPEKVDVWGNTQKRNPNIAVRAFENFISPGTYKEYKETEVDKMLKQLYAETGEGSVLPTSFSKNITVDGVKKDLSSKEYVEASKVAGNTKYEMLDQLIKNGDFKKLPAEQQAKIVKDVYSFGTVKGKQEVSDYVPDDKWYGNLEKAKEEGVSPTSFLLAKNFKGNIVTEKGGKGEGLQMYDYLIADKKTNAKQDLVLLETAGGVDMSQYRESSSNPENILSAYNLIQTEQMVGGDGTQQRIIKQLIADKNTTAKEDMAFVENVLKADMGNYKKASNGKDKDTLFLYNLMNTKNAKGDQKEKDADIERIQKEMKLNGREAREVYTKAQGNWHDSLNDYVAAGTDANNRKTRQARLDAFERRKWSDKDVLAGYNGLSGYGNAKKDVQIAILTEVFGSKAKATEFYNIKEGNKGYK